MMRCVIPCLMAVVLALSGCASNKQILAEAEKEKAKAEASVRVIKVAKKLPDQPKECGKEEKSGVVLGDRLDIAWRKAENALTRSNSRGARCNAWLNNLRAGFAK
jgi:hypothetical protein